MFEDQSKKLFPAKVARAFLPLMLLMAGGGAWAYFNATAPAIERAAPQRNAAVVQMLRAEQSDARIVVSAMGTVGASREVILKARVSGEVMSVAPAFVPGGYIAKGDVLLSLDDSDHRIEVQKAQSTLADAQAALELEQGSQTIAREELRLLTELSNEAIDGTDLLLRKPQLKQAQAAVIRAEAELRKATVDLSRTVVRLPFNALIIERHVHVGATIAAQDSLAMVVDADTFWVQANVPLDQLPLIDLDHEGGCPVVIRSEAGGSLRHGKVVQIAGKLSDTSRMATIIVAVEDPLGRHSENPSVPLMIDDYVHVEITGRNLPGVIELPRSALRDEDSMWVNTDNILDIRTVVLAWKSLEKVFVQSGISPGEQVIVSELAAPVKGMSIVTADASTDNSANLAFGKRTAK